MLFLLLIFVLPGNLQGQVLSGWEEFKSFSGRFRVLLPGEMVEKLDSIPTFVGTLAYHTFYYQSPQEEDSDNLVYMVSYCDYPEHTIHSDSTELLREFFDATMDAARRSVRGELTYQDEIEQSGFPGRLWRIDYLDGKAVIKTKALVVDRRYYAVQTITFRNRSLNLSTDRFLDSFRLLR